ncbi:acyl-CoA dehydrogenase family protein [Marinicaulis aureus]|uniref:Acyl-[acyl-carrier-protein] dehydrogenase MbtN n=1 Tax=Hyphococcus aureus TaxID=2666033 RepID=A0ABW1KTY7_9PROT
MQSSIFSEEHELFRETVRRFFREAVEPFSAEWERKEQVPRELWLQAGELGLLCPSIPETYGGAGGDFLYNVIVAEEIGYAIGGGSVAFSAHSDIVAYYLLGHAAEELKQEWLPKMVTGECLTSIAMTEPGAGSDLKAIKTRAVRDGDHYVLNGAKTFITNGLDADLVVVACKTNPEAGAKGISLIAVDTRLPGFRRGKTLEKIGQRASGTVELFFDDLRVPQQCLLGEEGAGFAIMMEELPRERLNIAIRAHTSALRAYEETVSYVKQRSVFDQAVFDFQTCKHALAEINTDLAVGRAFLDQCLSQMLRNTLTPEAAAMAKLWLAEMEWRSLDRCLQLHGGYGYMMEYPIARLFVDARSRRIYGGSSEIMREFVARKI